MSLKIHIQASGLSISANLKDEALPAVIKLIQENRDDSSPQSATPIPITGSSNSGLPPLGSAQGAELSGQNSDQPVRDFLKQNGAAELLNRLKWDGNSEKILLLGAWHEARDGKTPWRSSDMDEIFKQAKEAPPGNFGRDIGRAVKSGWVQALTPRTYSITRTGWNKIKLGIEGLTQEGQ